MRNNNNKGSRSNVNKHELVNCESSIILLKKIEKVKDFSFIRKRPYYRAIFNQIQGYPAPPLDVCLPFVLLFTIFIIVVTQKLVLQQSKNVTAKCTKTLSPPPSIQYLLGSDKAFEGTVVNRTLPFLHGGSLKSMITVKAQFWIVMYSKNSFRWKLRCVHIAHFWHLRKSNFCILGCKSSNQIFLLSLLICLLGKNNWLAYFWE